MAGSPRSPTHGRGTHARRAAWARKSTLDPVDARCKQQSLRNRESFTSAPAARPICRRCVRCAWRRRGHCRGTQVPTIHCYALAELRSPSQLHCLQWEHVNSHADRCCRHIFLPLRASRPSTLCAFHNFFNNPGTKVGAQRCRASCRLVELLPLAATAPLGVAGRGRTSVRCANG